MVYGSLLQIIGVILAVLFLFLHKFELSAIFIVLHLTGDIIEKLFVMPTLAKIEQAASQFVKLRPFLLFVGIALMLIGKFTHIDVRLTTSTGLFLLGFFLALIGGFTYDEIYT